jgi:hypothetical protein
MSMASIAFMLALAAIVTSAVRVTAANKWAESVRNCAEIGIDYAISKFNSEYPCPLDPADSSSSLISTMPTSELTANSGGETVGPGIPNVTVTITVKKVVDPAVWATLSDVFTAYSPQLDSSRSLSRGYDLPSETNVKAAGGGYRIVESTATNGIVRRTIRVLLKARFDLNRDGEAPASSSSTPSPQSYFAQPMFGNSSLDLSSASSLGVESATGPNVVHTEGTIPNNYNAFDLKLMTNRSVNIGAGAHVNGDVQIASNSSGSTNVVDSPGGSVDGRVVSNGTASDTVTFTPGKNATVGSDNVLAAADNPTSPGADRAVANQTPFTSTGNLSQYQMAPAPIGGGESIPSLSVASQEGMTLGGKSYSTQGLSTAGLTSPISFGNSDVPTKFFVQDSSTTASPNAVDIDASLISPGTNGRNLQIWYEGTKPVNINIPEGSSFRGLIYAPNAPVSIKGGDGHGQAFFEGAVVGKMVKSTLQGKMKVYTDLTNVSGNAKDNPNVKAELGYRLTADGPQIQGWQPISWQEY